MKQNKQGTVNVSLEANKQFPHKNKTLFESFFGNDKNLIKKKVCKTRQIRAYPFYSGL